ncbi:MAG TPA: type II toxin-antitoxin system RelE/ParE family toxin [Brevundimonas sp.]|jgi:plasmid stabilization system protein ParE|uniref:type II toxin-antitoxin system RelE/ParE family toxin n=1 Tax=Brevundimonas sp. TaxID=1871086 RepID=UPI002E143C2D|nr:type II toxin-antitoxin system RelE/ParE family toxin [Brevundimonas sp.]
MKVRLSRRAERDLAAQVDWLAQRSPPAARRALAQILGVIDLLEEHPLIGAATSRGWREKAVRFGRDGYVVCYVVRSDDLLVVRIFHSRQERRTPKVR